MQEQDQRYIIKRLDALGVLEQLKCKRILVTGGTGFVGRWFDLPGLDIVRINSASYADVVRDQSQKWDYIIDAQPGDPTWTHYAAWSSNARCMLISSGAIYDNPMTKIGQEKQRWEAFTRNHGNDWGFEHIIARVFTIAGYGARPGTAYAIDIWIRQGMAGKPLTVWNDGLSQRTYIYGADMAAWLLTVLANGENGMAYDVGGQEPVHMIDVAIHIADKFGVGIDPKDGPLDLRPRYIPPTLPPLGLDVWTSWKRAINKTIEEYRSEGSE